MIGLRECALVPCASEGSFVLEWVVSSDRKFTDGEKMRTEQSAFTVMSAIIGPSTTIERAATGDHCVLERNAYLVLELLFQKPVLCYQYRNP